MIRVDVQEYCHECTGFEPDTERPIRMFSGDNCVVQTDTVIRCEYRGRCESIRRYLERSVGKAGDENHD